MLAKIMNKEKEQKVKPKKVSNSAFAKMPVLSKLRLIVGSIFALSTLAIITTFAGVWLLGGFLILLSYLLVLVLMFKLFTTKKL